MDDLPEEDKLNNCKPTGPAGEMPGRYCEGTVRMTKHYTFSSGQAVAAMLFLSKLALDRHQHPSPPWAGSVRPSTSVEVKGLRKSHHAGRRAKRMQGNLEVGAILGSGSGTTVHEAWFEGRHVALKRVEDRNDKNTASRLLHESKMMRSRRMEPLLGSATVDLVATGIMYGSPIMITELMGGSVANGPPLSATQQGVCR